MVGLVLKMVVGPLVSFFSFFCYHTASAPITAGMPNIFRTYWREKCRFVGLDQQSFHSPIGWGGHELGGVWRINTYVPFVFLVPFFVFSAN